jgi:hypothetical protein
MIRRELEFALRHWMEMSSVERAADRDRQATEQSEA